MASDFLKKQAEKQAKGIRQTYGEGVYGSTPYIDRITEYEEQRRREEEEWLKQQKARQQEQLNAATAGLSQSAARWGADILSKLKEPVQRQETNAPRVSAADPTPWKTVADYYQPVLEEKKAEANKPVPAGFANAKTYLDQATPESVNPALAGTLAAGLRAGGQEYKRGDTRPGETSKELYTNADLMTQTAWAMGQQRDQMAQQLVQNPSLMYDANFTQGLNSIDARTKATEKAAGRLMSEYERITNLRNEQEEKEKYGSLYKNEDYIKYNRGDADLAKKGESATDIKLNRYTNIYRRQGEKDWRDKGGDPTLSDAESFLTDREAGNYFYIAGKQGLDAANEYYKNYLKADAEARKNQAVMEYTQNKVANGNYATKLAYSGASIVMNKTSVAGMLDLTFQNLRQRFGDASKPINYNTKWQLASNQADAIVKQVSNDIEKDVAKAAEGTKWEKYTDLLAEGATFLYQTVLSTIDSGSSALLVGMGLPEQITLGLMAGNAGMSAIRDAKERGASDGQALASGYAAAFAEYMFEKVSLDQLLEAKNIQNFGQFVKEFNKQGFVEGSEEFATEWATTLTDLLINGDKSSIGTDVQIYMANGVSEKEARKAAAWNWTKNIAMSFLGGYLSGGLMQGGNAAVNIATGGNSRLNLAAQVQVQMAVNQAINDNGRVDPDAVRMIENNPEALDMLRGTQAMKNGYRGGETGKQQIQSAIREIAKQERTARTVMDHAQQARLMGEYTRMMVEAEQQEAMQAEMPEARADVGTEIPASAEVEAPSPEGPPVPKNRAEMPETQQETAQERTAPPVLQQEQRLEAPTPPVPQNVQTAQEASGRLVAGGTQNGRGNTRLLWTAPKDNGGWKQKYNGNTPMLDALKATNEDLLAAYMAEGTEGNTDTPVIDAVIAVWEDVRQGTISPMAGAELVNQMWQAGKDDASKRAYLQSIYNPSTGNLTQQALKAARNIDIKHRGGLTVGQADNPAAAVGQQANAGQNENASAAEAAEAGNDLADGGRGRLSGQRAGEQDGRLAEAKRAVSQYNKASGRRADAKNLRAEEVDARDHIAEAAKGSKITIAPEQMVQQDKELRTVAQRLEEITGKKVYYIIGNIQRRGADGNVSQARGAITADGIYLRCDHNDLSVTQIGAHELYHYYEDLYPGLSARMKEKIIQTYSEEEFNKVAQVYVKKLGAISGLSDNQDALAREEALASIEREIFADAFGSINFGGAKADKFNALVRQTLSDTMGAETAAATARRTGPPGTQFSLNEFEDGKRFVDVQTDQNIFDGLSDTEKLALARSIIKKRFAGKVIGLDNQAFVNGRTGEEYSRIKQPLPDAKSGIMDAKARVSTELDNLVDAGFNYRTAEDGADGHKHPNLTGPYVYFDAIFKVGNEYFQGVVNMENNRNGRRLKDVTKIRNITKDTAGSYGNNPKTRFLRNASMPKVAETKPDVKTGFSADEENIPYNRTAMLTEETVDRWLKDYASASSPKYAQAYITRMSPNQFLKLTTSRTGRLVVGSQTGPMDAEKLIEATRQQPLQLRISDGEVVGHEGRHRATALDRANVRSIPVLIFDSSNKNSKTDVPEMVLQGQDFGSSRSYDKVTLENLVPLSYENRDRIVQEYGKQDAFERSAEKLGYRQTVRFSMDEETDAEYMAAAEAGEEQKAERYVKQAAKSWGAATDSEGKIIDLYHGTPRFGFTIFDNSGRQTATTGLIYTTTKREVSANYAGRENYAGVRQIGRQFIDGATRIQDIIQNAKSVTGFDYTELTDSKREELKKKPERISDELADRIDGLYDHSFDPGKWDDEDYTFANALSMVYDPFFIVRGRDTEGYTKEEMVEYLKPELESFEKNLETVRNYVSEHRDEFKAGNKALYDLLTGYDLFDAYVDLKYNYIPLLEEKKLLVNKRYDTDIAIPAKLQDTLEQRKDIGSYHLYGNLGNKPLTIDAKGGDWLGIRAPEFTGDDKVHSTDWLAQEAKKQGYTAIIIQNVYDGGVKADDYIFFDPSQVKSADPITYDDDGNIIPLSERFNPQKQDIRWSADEEEIPQSATEYARMKERDREREAELRRLEKSGKATEEQKKEAAALRKKNKAPKAAERKQQATIAKKDLRNTIISQFGIPNGRKAEIGSLIDAYADRIIRDKRLTYDDQKELFDKLYSEGVMTVAADDAFKAAREIVKGGRVYVSEKVKHDFGEDWNDFRKQAFAEGIYLTNNPEDRGADSWNAELATEFPGMFPDDNYDQKDILERIVSAAQAGRDEQMSLAEYAAKVVGQEYVSEDEAMDNMERRLDWALRSFADKAGLETWLKDNTEEKLAKQREQFGERLDAIRAQEIARQAKERDKRKEAARKQTLNRELREMQQRTLKQLQWLSKNRQKFSGNMQDQLNEILADIDVYAISAADEAHLDKASNKTWRELADIYKDARENDPNFLPSEDLKRIVERLDNRKIGDMDIDAVTDLYKAAVGLRTELYNRNNVIDSELHETFQEVYDQVKDEMQKAKGGYQSGVKGFVQRYFSDPQLTPMNRMERMAGWNKDSAWYKMAKQLEQGERAQRKFKTDSARMLAPFLEEHKEWVKKADGQGKDAIWYEVEVPELLELGMGDKPIFGNTVKVYMTPAQKVHMYLESQNYDNLRHMTGGRTFADKELYSKGKREEAFAQGKTIRLAPETVKNLVKDLTPEEKALADALRPFYNEFSKKEINRVSNLLLGYDKAMEGDYAPIYTNKNYTKSEPGIFDTTAEGVGNLKSRVVSANPSLNISALDAFEKSVDRTSRYVGLAVPVRNMNTLMNWREKGNSMADALTHKWGADGKKFVNDLLTELQSGRETEQSSIEKLTNAALSRYISAVFGANPSIVTKQFASYPLAAAYLGWDNMPLNVPRAARVDTDLIAKYTGEYDYRQLGYAMPETATLKDNPGKLQERGPLNFIFGGGAITWMDGFTVRTLWTWAENKVNKEQPGLERGSQADIDAGNSEYYKAVAAEFEEALSRSQPMYDTMHRANIMRESNPIVRAFTLFKTVPMQEHNMLRQAIGEAQYAKEAKLDKETQAAARQKAGRAFAGILTGNLMIGAITILNALWKNRGKKYRDEDGELSAEKLIAEAGKQYFKDAAGLVIGGGEAADILSAILFGDKWYGLETPGMEQIESILAQTVKAGQTVQGLVKDSIEVLANGGNWAQYMADHSDKYLSAVDSVARTLGTYATGLPIDNVKAYLLGAVQWLSPAVNTAYEDALKKADRSGLKGLSGASLEIRTKHILQERAGSADEETAETLAGLYAAGYKDAIPAAQQTKVSIDGEERQMNLAQQQTYKRAWQETVGGSIDELVSSDEFREADEATQAKMLKKLYDLASDRAKRTLFDDAEENTWEKAEGMLDAGISLADYVSAYARFNAIKNTENLSSYDKGKRQREMINGMDYGDDAKLALYQSLNPTATSRIEKFKEIMGAGISFDNLMEVFDKYSAIDERGDLTASGKSKEFALWVDNQKYSEKQKQTIKDQLLYWQQMSAQTERYDKIKAQGFDPNTAAAIDKALSDLTPLPGKDGVSNAQKWNAALDVLGPKASKKEKLSAVSMFFDTAMTTESGKPSQWAKINRVVDSGKSVEDTMKLVEDEKLDVYVKWMDSDAKAAGIKSDTYISFREKYNNTKSVKDENGKDVKGQTKKDQMMAYINGLNLTADQKDKLFLEEYAESGLKDTPWHKGGGKGSGSYAPARLVTRKTPEAPRAAKPRSGLVAMGKTKAAARPQGGLVATGRPYSAGTGGLVLKKK